MAMLLLLARVTGVAAVVNLGVLILREDRPTGDSIPVNLSKPCAGCRVAGLPGCRVAFSIRRVIGSIHLPIQSVRAIVAKRRSSLISRNGSAFG